VAEEKRKGNARNRRIWERIAVGHSIGAKKNCGEKRRQTQSVGVLKAKVHVEVLAVVIQGRELTAMQTVIRRKPRWGVWQKQKSIVSSDVLGGGVVGKGGGGRLWGREKSDKKK